MSNVSRVAVPFLGLLLCGAASAQSDRPPERVFELRIEGQKLAGGARVIRVNEGDAVRLRWSSTAAVVVHLHGYDLERLVEPGAVAEMTFTARAGGRFPIHVHSPGAATARAQQHHHDAPLAHLEVRPR